VKGGDEEGEMEEA